jgi:hypothetical protein
MVAPLDLKRKPMSIKDELEAFKHEMRGMMLATAPKKKKKTIVVAEEVAVAKKKSLLRRRIIRNLLLKIHLPRVIPLRLTIASFCEVFSIATIRKHVASQTGHDG